MPRIRKPPPKVKYLSALLKAYKTASGMTSEDMALILGERPETVRRKLNRPVRDWRISDLECYAKTLSIPKQEMLEAVGKDM